MSRVIVQSAILSASNADILQGGRLQTVPELGTLTFEMSASVATAAAQFVTSIQLPNGSTPLNGVLVPANAVVGQLDDRNKLAVQFATGQGGHAVFSVVLTGASVLTYRVTFRPLRQR